MKKLICGNGNTYEVHDETVCCPSGSANVRNYFEIYMPEEAMTFDQFEALCKNEEAMGTLRLQSMQGDEMLALSHYTVPAKLPKSALRCTTTRRAGLQRRCACMPEWNSLPIPNSSLPDWG